jgi:N-acetylglucosamine-6-sulfatase
MKTRTMLPAVAATCVAFVAGLAALGNFAQYAAPAKPMNVVFILSDDHRYDFMGFMGTPPFLETPNLNRIRAKGMWLRNAFVSTALCSPSRASILTGQYAHRHGVVDNQHPIPEGTVFFPQLLQGSGYDTAFFGKWHMGEDDDSPQPGFDRWVSFQGQGDYYNPMLNVDGTRSRHQGYTAEILTDYSLEWLQNRDSDAPFFLYLSHKSVHAMFEPGADDLGRYQEEAPVYPVTMANTEENYAGHPPWVREQRSSWHGVDYMYHGDMDFDTFYRRYTETLYSMDKSIGRVLDYLEANGLQDNTMVVYMSDNGFSFGEHGLIDKRHMYEESMRVPMLVYAPGMTTPGSESDRMVQNVDIAPTLLSLAGVPVPDNMDGRSILPVLQQQEVSWRDSVMYEYYWEWNFPQTPTTLGLRSDRFKYIFYHGVWGDDELFDLEADPLEQHNLFRSAAHQDVLAGMRDELFGLLESTGGLQLPLKSPQGFRAAERGPAPDPQ